MKPLYKFHIYIVLILNTLFSVVVFANITSVPYLNSSTGLAVALINITGIVVFRWLNERNK